MADAAEGAGPPPSPRSEQGAASAEEGEEVVAVAVRSPTSFELVGVDTTTVDYAAYIGGGVVSQAVTGRIQKILAGTSDPQAAQVTTTEPHPFVDGNVVRVSGLQSGVAVANGDTFSVFAATATTFRLSGATLTGTHTNGGHVALVPSSSVRARSATFRA